MATVCPFTVIKVEVNFPTALADLLTVLCVLSFAVHRLHIF